MQTISYRFILVHQMSLAFAILPSHHTECPPTGSAQLAHNFLRLAAPPSTGSAQLAHNLSALRLAVPRARPAHNLSSGRSATRRTAARGRRRRASMFDPAGFPPAAPKSRPGPAHVAGVRRAPPAGPTVGRVETDSDKPAPGQRRSPEAVEADRRLFHQKNARWVVLRPTWTNRLRVNATARKP